MLRLMQQVRDQVFEKKVESMSKANPHELVENLAANSGGARNFFLPGHYRGTIISNGAHLAVAHRPRKACKPGPFLKPAFPVYEFATKSTCLLCGMR